MTAHAQTLLSLLLPLLQWRLGLVVAC